MRLSHARRRDRRAVRRSEPRVVRRAGAGDGVGRAVRAGDAARRAADDRGRRAARTPRRRSSRWSPGWSPARTRSTTWTCCATAGWAGCSPGCAPRRRWARSCARSPSATSASSTPSPPGCWPGWPRRRPVLPGAEQLVFVDIDDTVRQTYGYAKQGAGLGYTGVKGLNALLAIVSTPMSAPVIAATRLRKGSTNSARGAAKLLADALATVAAGRRDRAGAGARGLGLLRPRHHRRRPPRRGPVLDHRPAHPDGGHGDRQHRRAGLDPDPLPERDLRRRRAAVDLRRRGRRDRASPRSPAAARPSTSPPG